MAAREGYADSNAPTFIKIRWISIMQSMSANGQNPSPVMQENQNFVIYLTKSELEMQVWT